MIRLAVALCKKRHPLRATAYESSAQAERIEAVLREQTKLCPECGGRTMAVEHSDTAFQTLAEAVPHVAQLNGVKRWSATPKTS